MSITLQTEIRKLPYNVVSQLGEITEIGKCWKDVMGLIPKDLSIMDRKNYLEEDYDRKYSSENIHRVAQVCSTEGLNGMEVVIEEWGTSGIVRPNVSNLIWTFERAGQIRAACFLKEMVEDISFDKFSDDFPNSENIKSSHFSYSILQDATSKFSNIPFKDGGSFIGKGAFGVVYKGTINYNSHSKVVAIKRLNEKESKSAQQFSNEIETLQKCIHPNILKLEGYSIDGNHWCLVYEFIENGSLLDHLSCSRGTMLTWKQKIEIAIGAAEGISYLHSFEPPLVHRDIKTANILLDGNFIAKIGDFGLVHLGGKGTQTAMQTSIAFGTSAYMAPEAFRGDVSIKMDTFSFGVVLLELLTGLPSYDENREGVDLLTHVIDYEGDDLDLLDPNSGLIDESISTTLFDLAYSCTKHKKSRPVMKNILDSLKIILGEI